MKSKRFGLLLVWLFLISSSSYGAIYYVALNGNDGTGDGSEGRPWRTIAHAISKIPAAQNHTLQLGEGVFIENQFIRVPAGVSIQGAGLDKTVIKASSSLYYYPSAPGYATDKYLFIAQSGSPVNGNQSFKGFTINGDGKKLHGGIFVQNRNNIVIENIKVEGTNFNAIWLWSVKDSKILNSQFYNNAWSTSGWSSGAINIGNTERVEIAHCYIDDNKGYGIKAIGPGGNNLQSELKIHDCHVTVESNNATGNNIAIELWMVRLLNCEIYNNYLDNDLSLVNPDLPSTSTQTIRVYNNTFDLMSRAGGGAYGIELTLTDAEIDHNYFIGGKQGIVNWGPTLRNWKIHHNTFYGLNGNSYPGDVLRVQEGLADVKFYNNTVEFTGTTTVNVISIQKGAGTNLEILNNLVINSNTGYNYFPNKILHLESGASVTNLKVHNNSLYKIPQGNVPGSYSNNITVDPQIVKSGNRPSPYYVPTAQSPLIDAGIDLGFAFLGAASDIGAFEYGGASAPSNQRPLVSITSPANNAEFASGASVSIAANANDNDGSISKVVFFNGTAKLGEDASAPYTFSWKPATGGTYSITAVATDNAGAASTSSAVSIVVKKDAVTFPVPGMIQAEDYSGMNGIQLEQTTDTGGGQNVGWYETGDWIDYHVNVASAGTYTVEYRVASLSQGGSLNLLSGTTKLATTQVPSTGAWQSWRTIGTDVSLKAGLQTIRLQAGAGAFNLNWIRFTPISENAAPTVSLTNPQNNATFSAPANITLSANAADPDGTITQVSFYNGKILLGTDTSSPYDFRWANAPEGTYSISAVATDAKGASTTSSAVTVTVQTASSPNVTIMAPADMSNFSEPANITILSNATDADGTITKVEFFNATTKIGEDLSSPYSYNWANVKAGIYSVTAKATDNAGNTSTSQPVKITVNGTGSLSIPGIIEAERFIAMSGVYVKPSSVTDEQKIVAGVESPDWMDYSVNVRAAGKYQIEYRVSSLSAGGKVELRSGTQVLATTMIPPTGAWQEWTSVYATLDLPAGTQVLRLQTTSGEFNINWIECVEATEKTATAIPGTVLAENYLTMNGIQLEKTKDTDGGKNAGWIDTGDWMDYEINVAHSGKYSVEYRVASSPGGGKIELRNGQNTLATTDVPSTGAWQEWTSTESSVISLPEGKHIVRLYAAVGGFNINWIKFTEEDIDHGGAFPIPGTIQAEDYATMKGIQVQATTDTGGGQNVGWTDAGDWMDYTVNVTDAGKYTVQYRVATELGTGDIQLQSGSTTLASNKVEPTGGWQTWVTISSTITLEEGVQTLRLYVGNGIFNINWINFISAATDPTDAVVIPGTIQAENFDDMSGIDVQATLDTGGGQNVGWTDAGDWMDYTVNVTESGEYTVHYRIAAVYSGAGIQLKSGDAVLATTEITPTQGWQTWNTISTTVKLEQGVQTLRVYITKGIFNLNWVHFDYSTSSLHPTLSRIFSPNNDGINDYWIWPEGEMYQNCKLTISSQLGQIVYDVESYQNNWDGTLNGTPLPGGAYYYVVICGGEKISGTITIVR